MTEQANAESKTQRQYITPFDSDVDDLADGLEELAEGIRDRSIPVTRLTTTEDGDPNDVPTTFTVEVSYYTDERINYRGGDQ